MKMPVKVLLLVAPVVLAAPLALLLRYQSAKAEGDFVASGHLANGIEVRTSLLSKEQTQTLRFLGASAGQITLDHIPMNRRVEVGVVIRRRGKQDERHLSMVPFKSSQHEDYSVCIIPLGIDIHNAAKLKIVVESKSDTGTCSMPQIFNNPFKGNWGMDENFAISEDKTGVTLIAGTQKNAIPIPAGDVDAEILFEVKTMPAPIAR